MVFGRFRNGITVLTPSSCGVVFGNLSSVDLSSQSLNLFINI